MHNHPARFSRVVLCHLLTSEATNLWPFSLVVVHLEREWISTRGREWLSFRIDHSGGGPVRRGEDSDAECEDHKETEENYQEDSNAFQQSITAGGMIAGCVMEFHIAGDWMELPACVSAYSVYPDAGTRSI